jgi:hypothetical protein
MYQELENRNNCKGQQKYFLETDQNKSDKNV